MEMLLLICVGIPVLILVASLIFRALAEIFFFAPGPVQNIQLGSQSNRTEKYSESPQ